MAILLFLAGFLVVFAFPIYAVSDPAKISDIEGILERIITLLAPAAGIAFFLMMLVGGYQFLTSGGDPKSAGAARNTLTFAVIGIILVVASWLILTLIRDITGADVTNVGLPPEVP